MNGDLTRDYSVIDQLSSIAFDKGVHNYSTKKRIHWVTERACELAVESSWTEIRIAWIIARVVVKLSERVQSESQWDNYLITTSF